MVVRWFAQLQRGLISSRKRGPICYEQLQRQECEVGSELTIDTAATLAVMNAVMPRPLRIQYAGARYHVISRCDRREAIFYDDADRLRIGSASYVSGGVLM